MEAVRTLRINSPCAADWNEMEPRGHGRHCASCDRVVVDLTRATATEARGYAALYGGSGRLCGRLRVDADGDAILRRERVAPRSAARGASSLLVVSALGASACSARGAGDPGVDVAEVSMPSAVAPETDAAPAKTACPRPAPVVARVTSIDRDGDGVSDETDQCPDQAGTDPVGCPSKLVSIEMLGDIDVIERVQFASQSSVVTQGSIPIIDATAQILKANAKLVVKVTGHADATEGSADVLGLARANAVIARLVGLGIPSSRMIAATKGSTLPLASNATPADRERNRRVEFEIQ